MHASLSLNCRKVLLLSVAIAGAIAGCREGSSSEAVVASGALQPSSVGKSDGRMESTGLISKDNPGDGLQYIGWNKVKFTLALESVVRYYSKTQYIDTTLSPGTYQVSAATLGDVPRGNGAALVSVKGVAPLPPTLADTAPAALVRPAYNTGTGFFVAHGALYDPAGKKFRIRGVNRGHWDSYSPNISYSGANTVRATIDFSRPPSANAPLMQEYISKKLVPMPSNWSGTCKTDPAILSSIVDEWIAQAPMWTKFNKWMLLNIANEWGPENSELWRDQYILAISRLRSAGYDGAIVVTSGGCGQDPRNLLKYAEAVFNSDPQKNIVFDLHLYGVAFPGNVYELLKPLAGLGIPVIIGEFGPGRNIGPSPTLVTPMEVIQAAEALNFGWLAWAWDDNNLEGARSDDNWFSMTYRVGIYESPSDLTIFGKFVVLDPVWGLATLGKKASVFGLEK